MIPKSKTLRQEVQKSAEPKSPPTLPKIVAYDAGKPIPIREVKCFNDFVAILQFKIKFENIEMVEGSDLKNEGMVIGVGPGIPTVTGTRCPSQLKLGDVVAFYGNPATAVLPTAGPYVGQRVIMITERAMMYRLPPVPFTIITDDNNEQATEPLDQHS